MPRPPVNDRGLSEPELDLIERYETLFNRVESNLRERLRLGEEVWKDFTDLVNECFPRAEEETRVKGNRLKACGRLRNALVHRRRRSYQYVAIPTRETLRQLEECYFELVGAGLATENFPNQVETIQPDQTLAYVLDRIRQKDFSQFPVYDGQVFVGLLTENGIIRWLADNLFLGQPKVEFNEVKVEQVFLDRTLVRDLLNMEETTENVMFEQATITVEEVRRLFAMNELLEAALITRTGKPNEGLLAIATRWDVAAM
jgi:predicted transcriptional regulator